MVSVVPFGAHFGWYSFWLDSLREGENEKNAIIRANQQSTVAGKFFSRCTLLTPRLEELMLSVAVEGGNRKLRDIRYLPSIGLSEHGNWRKNHLGALEACYGRSPFFEHLMALLKPVFDNSSLNTLSSFNAAFHEAVKSFLFGNFSFKGLNNLCCQNVVLKERGEEILKKIKPEISIIDPLMRLGPETLLALATNKP